MHDYQFTGAYPRVLTGLSQGVNACLLHGEGQAPDYGSTIEAYPGDRIRTYDAPYVHPELVEIELAPEPIDAPPAGPPVPVLPLGDTSGIDVLRAAAEAATPASDPAHDAMTAEGAPAPAEPTL